MKPPQQSLLLHVPHESVAPPSAGKGCGEQPRVKRKDCGDSSEAGREVVDERESDAAVSADKGMKQSRHHYHHHRHRHRQARIGLIRDGHGAAKGQRQSYLNGDANNEFKKRNSRGREEEEEEEEESRSEFESRSRSSAVGEKEGVHDNGKQPSSVTRSAHQQEMVDNVNSMSEREHKEDETQHKESSRSMDRMVAEAGEGGSEREDGEVESDGDDDTAPIAQEQEQDGPEIKRGIIETSEKPQRRGGWQRSHHNETSEDIGFGDASGTERVGEEGALLQTLDSGNKGGDSQEQVLANASKSLVRTMELDEGAKGIAASTTADALEEIKGARESLYELEMSRTSEAGCKPVIAMMQDANEMSGDDLMRRIVKDQLRVWEKERGKEARQEEEEEERARAKKQRVENGALLSLALPDTSLSLSSGDPHSHQSFPYQNFAQSYHPSQAQTHTHSSGFTNLMSLSHSQPLLHHNPSCSLTQSSLDKMEMSSGSQQISQVKEQESHGSWQVSYGSNYANEGFLALPVQGKQRPKPLIQRLFQSGNDHHSLGSECLWNQGRERGESDIVDIGQGSHQVAPADFELQATHSSDARQQQKHWQNNEVRSLPSYGESSRDTQPQNLASHVERIPSREKRLLERGAIGPETFTSIQVQDVVSELIPLMACKLQELPDSFLEGLKGSLRNMLNCIEKREQFVLLQQTLAARTDLITDTLLRAHRVQLELLVAVKTGIPAFLHPEIPMTHSALVEVFLQTKCRNFACQSQLPADECDCKLCAQKTGFCNSCMCVVCSKFDFDANTCRWIGCDFCLHWCHTDCGIRMGYIAPGPSICGAAGTSEMQFHCIACDHTSELYGFVKDVFCNCAQQWSQDVLASELDCVRRIFHDSNDARGQQLCSKAEQMLRHLGAQVDLSLACSTVLKFFSGKPYI
jgi:hypothetical protein